MQRIKPSYDIKKRKREKFSKFLTAWYNPSRRPFAWRESSDLYFVTVCEVMLQRTNAEKVALLSERLFQEYPKPEDLAAAPRDHLAALLQPLGLPRRVDHIKAIAAAFSDARAVGHTLHKEELAVLPGIGPYVLAAVTVLGLGESDAVIDEHVLRILRRVFSIHAPERRHPTKALRHFARSLVPPKKSREYNLAILDLGRLICRPTNPKCNDCPVRQTCDYAASGGCANDSINRSQH